MYETVIFIVCSALYFHFKGYFESTMHDIYTEHLDDDDEKPEEYEH